MMNVMMMMRATPLWATKAALSRMFAVPTHVCQRHNCKHTNMSHPFNIQQSEINTWVSCNTNIGKGTTDPRVEFLSQVQKQILIKFHLQNLDQISASP